MKDTSYRWMTKRRAAAALEEYLAERPAALRQLRAQLTADGLEPDSMLDGSTASLIPLWRWIAARLLAQPEPSPAATARPAPAPADPEWPSWARYVSGLYPQTPPYAVTLLDGLISYLGHVITAAAPDAAWQVGYHRVKAYHLQNHPVLSSPHTDSQNFLPGLVTVVANRLRSGMDPLREDEFASYADAAITRLRGEHEDDLTVAAPEPLVEVETGNDADDRVFDVGLREDLAHEHSRQIDRMVKELRAQPGVASVIREDREMLLVSAPEWNAGDLEQWLLAWIRHHLRDAG